ncbi:2,3-bisphosphoglycerate-dependent phosphoglycerate [Musa troglodytarum]|uniref:2,3-bisphosphoglycerate-dependent phosphoglycerate n=1 Tax=Musa troglodytarum TaxID=320322 RepID=A0A9E7HWH4_9LILI|nr:2,3-bisphosphoglycerate-dependent phosphoglycerate [Musa troglodytarum]
MASSACHHALGLIQAQGNSPRTGLQDKVGSFSLELVSKDMQLLSRGSHYPGSRKLCLVRASRSHSSVADLITISSNSNSSDSQKRSSAMQMYGELQGLNKQETAARFGKEKVISLELSTGIPMLSILKKGKFIRRGGPIGPSEAGVYAYTRPFGPDHDSYYDINRPKKNMIA